MASEALRSLSANISFKSDNSKLVAADSTVNSLKMNTEELFDTADNATEMLDSASQTLTNGFGQVGNSASQATKKTQTLFKKVKSESKSSQKDVGAVTKEVTGIGVQADKVSGQMTGLLKKSIPNSAIASIGPLGLVAAAVLAIGTAAVSAGKDSQRLFKELQQNTGMTKAELSGVSDIIDEFGRSSYLDLDEIFSISSIGVNFLKEPEENLLRFNEQVELLARVTGESTDLIGENTADIAKAWGLADNAAIDSLQRFYDVSSQTELSLTDLQGYVIDYSDTFTELGFSIDDSIGLIGSWVNEGYEAENLLEGLATATEGLAENEIADLREGLQKGISILEETGDETQALMFAEQLFGKKGSKQFLSAIQSQSFALEGLGENFEDQTERLNQLGEETLTFEDQMRNFKNNIHFELAPIGEELLNSFGDVLTELQPFISKILELVAPAFSLIAEFISGLAPIISKVGTLFTTLIEPWIPLIKKVADILSTALGGAFENISIIIDTFIEVAQGTIDFWKNVFVGDFDAALESLKGIFDSVFNGISGIFKNTINTLIKGFNSFFSGLSNISIPDWVPIVGGNSFSFPTIPLLAEGTDNFEGGTAIVGEKGPELVELPKGARVTPNKQTEDLLSNTGSNTTNISNSTTSENNYNSSVTENNYNSTKTENAYTESKIENILTEMYSNSDIDNIANNTSESNNYSSSEDMYNSYNTEEIVNNSEKIISEDIFNSESVMNESTLNESTVTESKLSEIINNSYQGDTINNVINNNTTNDDTEIPQNVVILDIETSDFGSEGNIGDEVENDSIVQYGDTENYLDLTVNVNLPEGSETGDNNELAVNIGNVVSERIDEYFKQLYLRSK